MAHCRTATPIASRGPAPSAERSGPLDARTGRSVPLAHDEPGIDRQRVFGVSDLSLYGSLGLGGRSRCVAAAPWAGWPPDRVAAAKISTALDTLVGRNEALAASSPVDSGGLGRAHAAAMLAQRQGAGIGGLDPAWCYAGDRLRTLRSAPCFRRKKV